MRLRARVARITCAVAALAGATGCTSNGTIPLAVADASVPDSAAPPSGADAAPSEDAVAPPIADSGAPPDATDAMAADAATCAWSGTYESPACASCLRASCCAAVTTCEGDPKCVELDTCVDDCLTADAGDGGSVSTCAQACADQQVLPVRNEWQALNSCIELDCYNGGAGPCQ